jgi:hypothetical protein
MKKTVALAFIFIGFLSLASAHYVSERDFVITYKSSDYNAYDNHRFAKNYGDYRPSNNEVNKKAIVYYGFDRTFDRTSDGARYYYKPTNNFGGYNEVFRCYDHPPKNKLFYIKCH